MDRRKVERNNVVREEERHQEREGCCRGESQSYLGKSKKSYNAEVLSVGSIPPAPATPKGRAATIEEPFTFELAAAAPCASTPMRENPQPTPCADRQDEKLADLADAVSGVEARLLCRLQALEELMTALQREVIEKCATPPLPWSAPLPPLPPATLPPLPPATLPPPATSTPGPTGCFQEEETPTAVPTESPALRDVSSLANIIPTGTQEGYAVPPDIVGVVLLGCKSRRNLAARLASRIFSANERCGSNCRGVLGKTPLDVNRVKAIYSICMQHFPLQRLETQLAADKEMRTAIDEICRKTKIPRETENYIYSYGGGSLV